MIRNDFYQNYNAWDGKDTNIVFTVGTTSDALKSIGMKDQEIQLRSGTVLVSLELLPSNKKKTKILDVSFITSAYAKNALQKYINENSILYIETNKKGRITG